MDVERAAAAYHTAIERVDTVKAENAERLRQARSHVETARSVLAQAIVEAYGRGERVGDLARRTGYSRETIRVVLRTAGVEPE